MRHAAFSREVPYSARQMFDLVADLASYPRFVPNCMDMQVTPVSANEIKARMSVKFGPVAQAYTSHVKLDEKAGTIAASSNDGPFTQLNSLWRFTPSSKGSRVAFDISFELANPLMAALAEPAFAAKQEEIVEAFLKEAKKRYG